MFEQAYLAEQLDSDILVFKRYHDTMWKTIQDIVDIWNLTHLVQAGVWCEVLLPGHCEHGSCMLLCPPV